MKSISKAVILAGIMALAVLLTGQSMPANAAPTALTINGVAGNASLALNATAPIAATFNDEPNGSNAVLSLNPTTVGSFIFSTTVTGNNDVLVQTPTNPLPASTTSISLADDADATVEATTLQVLFLCGATAGTTTISLNQGGGTAISYTITCGSTITLSGNTATVAGAAINVTVPCTGAAQQLTASIGAFGTPTANGTYVSPTSVNCVAAGTMVAPYTCSAAGTVTFTFNAGTATLTCASTTGGLVLSAASGYSATVSGTCTSGAVLTQTGPAYFAGATLNGVTVTTVAAGSITCSAAGTIIATLVCNSTGVVSLALGGMTGSFTCTYGSSYGGYNPYLNTYPYNNCGAGYPYNQYSTNGCYNQQQYTNLPSSLTIATASPSVACGGTSAVTVRVMGANGQTVADGTAVALAASVGTLSPASGSTSAGAVSATYTAPSAVPNTSVTLRATAGAASNTTGISITCAPAPAASQPSSPPPSYAPPLPPAGLVISPPNTGDAGLLALVEDGSD